MENVSEHVEKATKLVEKGKLEAAIQEYLLALAADPNNGSVAEKVAELYLRLEQPAKAQDCYVYLFDQARGKGDAAVAINVFRKVIKIGPADPSRLMDFAKLLETENPEEAAATYQSAAEAFSRAKDFSGAVDAMGRLAALEPANADLQCLLAETAAGAGKKEIAATALLHAAEIQRTQVGAAGQAASVLPLVERAHQMNPDDLAVTVSFARLLVETGAAKRTVDLLLPLSKPASGILGSDPDLMCVLGQAYLALHDPRSAEAALSPIAGSHPDAPRLLVRASQKYLETGHPDLAVNLLERVRETLEKDGKGQEFAGLVEQIPEAIGAAAPFLEFQAQLYGQLRQDHKTGRTLGRLFDLYLAERNFTRATDALERVVLLDPFENETRARLQKLKGKIDAAHWQAIADAVQVSADPATDDSSLVNTQDWRELVPSSDEDASEGGGSEAEGNMLEDLVLQAEIFLQYGLKNKAAERLDRVNKLFPGAEDSNEKLRNLYVTAGIKVEKGKGARPKAATPAAQEEEDIQVDFGHAGEISRNIFRQGTVKNVLFTAVNDIGRTWRVSKCVAALCPPGKTPSALLEFCATGMTQSDALSLVKLVHGAMKVSADGTPQSFEDAESSPKLTPIAPIIKTLGVKSLLALPFMEGDQQTGIMLLEQCDRRRKWRASEVMVLKTITDQMVMAASHVKLRSLMKSLAVTDERTGMLTRGAYIDCLMAEISRLQQGGAMCVALLQFGRANQLAKESGDENLRKFMDEAGLAVASHLRQNDVAIKYDSTTLALVMPGTKGGEGMQVMEKMRRIVGTVKISEKVPPFTYGVAEPLHDDATDAVDSVTELVNRLEQALDEAHKEGGNGGKFLAPEFA